jgi:serine/threonine protein kinase
MDETKSATQTEASLAPGAAASASSDETRSLSGTAGSQPPIESSNGSSNGDPSQVGSYRVIHRLGQGGFGTVYLAHDEDLDRGIAVKVPNPERITHPGDIQAFLVEVNLVSTTKALESRLDERCRHPGSWLAGSYGGPRR